MKKIFTCFATLLVAISLNAQTSEFFKPYRKTELRLPAVPIIVNDPYLSIWSPYDKLYSGPTRHWTNAEKAIDGLLRVDGTTYRFMGVENPFILKSIMPMASEGAWEAPTTFTTQSDDTWTGLDFDDTSWAIKQGAFGTASEYPNVNTAWTNTGTNVYVRRTVTLTAADLQKDLYLEYSHDDICEIYINGHKVVDTGYTWGEAFTLQLTSEMKNYLVEGDNVIAAHCYNKTGGAYLDYGLYQNVKTSYPNIQNAVQQSVHVLATNTYYTFKCGNVNLDVVFTAPMLIDDLDLLSTPINYISYQVTSNDGNEHDVQFYLATNARIGQNETNKNTMSKKITTNGTTYLMGGNLAQNVLGRTGDGICIDWGYVYLPAINGTVSLASSNEVESSFVDKGTLPTTSTKIIDNGGMDPPTMAYTYDFGSITQGSNFAMLGYNEIKDIEYMGKQYLGYWARNGKNITDAFCELRDNYNTIMEKCRALDKRIYDDAMNAGNKKYAEILSGSYRQVIAAHKLFQDEHGHTMFFSKENNSGGFINTLDVTYPSEPLFLVYNTELAKGMITSMFEYCTSEKWGFPFAAHDLGHYPIANGQHYSITSPDSNGGYSNNMPLEETGNMLILAAMISKADGNTTYVDKYWDTLKSWTDYLVEYGQDPANQVCTDDFAGFLAHNANLSLKAIMGIAGFSEMAKMKGDNTTAETYMAKAKAMAAQWESDVLDANGDHYDLTLDKDNTWSQKYNMVWDKIWNTNVMQNDPMKLELDYYKTKQNKYGMPLDSRSDYTKADWIMWSAAMADDNTTFLNLINPIYKYINETTSRVPISDWYYSTAGTMVGFKARSVIGGFWIKVLLDKFNPNKNDKINADWGAHNSGGCAIDVDNDGYRDFIVAGVGNIENYNTGQLWEKNRMTHVVKFNSESKEWKALNDDAIGINVTDRPSFSPCDINADGIMDVVTFESTGRTPTDVPFKNGISKEGIFIGNGDGTFTQPNFKFVNESGEDIAFNMNNVLSGDVADFNNDGLTDIACIGYYVSGSIKTYPDYNYILINKGNNTFMVKPFLPTGQDYHFECAWIKCYDLNNDGYNDFIISGNSNDINTLGNPNDCFTDIFINNPENPGTFTRQNVTDGTLIKPITSSSICIGDVNNDGVPDLFLSGWRNNHSNGYVSNIYLGKIDANGKLSYTNGGGIFAIKGENSVSNQNGMIDWNGNGQIDIFDAGFDSNLNTQTGYLLYGDGNGNFTNSPSAADRLAAGNEHATFFVDWNGDGVNDIATLGYCEDTKYFDYAQNYFAVTLNTNAAPARPVAPTIAPATFNGSKVTISWTPAASSLKNVTYEYYIMDENGNVVSSCNSIVGGDNDGVRKVNLPGNACQNNKITIVLPKGKYKIGVQTVDAHYQGSKFNVIDLEQTYTAINNITNNSNAKVVSRYNANGQRVNSETRGINVVKYSNGNTKKIINK